MKILVTIKRVPDPEQRPKIKGNELDLSGASWVVNTFDEYAVETALRLLENGETRERFGEIVVLTLGSKDAAQQLRFCLAMGADRAILIEADETAIDADVTARAIQAVVATEKPDLVLMGKQAVDSDNSVVAQLLAGLLGWPQVTSAASIETGDGHVVVKREADSGVETKKVRLPALVTVDLRVVLSAGVKNHKTPDSFAYPEGKRYASPKGIMKAKQKELKQMTLAELGVTARPRLKWVKIEAPPARKAGVKVESVQELLAKLAAAAKVI